MTEQMALDLREYDLPPEWDGVKITWEAEWQAEIPMFICPPPPPEVCRACGRAATRAIKKGVLDPHRVGYRDRYNQIRKGWERGVLMALRCSHCGADDVIDYQTGEVWMLGPEDYGERGSYLQEVDDD